MAPEPDRVTINRREEPTPWLGPLLLQLLIVFGLMLLTTGLLAFLGYLKVRKIRGPRKTIESVKTELAGTLASELAARKFAYTRTDGSEWTLALKDVLDRITALEMAYNVNDCVELRWGAAEGSEEAGSCERRASQAQRAKMSEYRAWFSERRRPPRD